MEPDNNLRISLIRIVRSRKKTVTGLIKNPKVKDDGISLMLLTVGVAVCA